MDSETSSTKFKQADHFFRSGQYAQALEILEELNRQHPNAKNVMYPAAMCLDKLGRSQEALPLCIHLISAFQDPRAAALKMEIEGRVEDRSLAGLGAAGAMEFDSGLDALDLLDIPSTTVPHKPVEPEGIPWLKYGLIALAVVVVGLLIIGPIMTYEPPPPGSEPTVVAEDRPVNTTMIYVGMFACYLTIVMFQVAGAYLALMIMRALPHRDVGSNVFNLSASFFLSTLLEGSFFGIFLTAFYFAKVYDLGFGGIVFLYIARIIFGTVGFLLGFAIFIGSIAHLFQDTVVL